MTRPRLTMDGSPGSVLARAVPGLLAMTALLTKPPPPTYKTQDPVFRFGIFCWDNLFA